ncbi:MAG: DUF1592 domain-containing protein [Myxococcota bacterium]
MTRHDVRGRRIPPGSALALALSLALGACTGTIGDGAFGRDGQGGGGDPTLTGDGPELWAQLCAGCHGDFGLGSTLSSGDDNGDFRLDAVAALELHGDELEAYIAETMPFGNAERCVGDCADTLGSYLRGIQPPPPVICTGDEAPPIGHREVKLLSSREYQRSLEDLLGVPTDVGARVANHDGRRGGFVDMVAKPVSSTLLDTYVRNATDMAGWAVANGRPFACDGSAGCANRFVNEFLYALFRGPVSAEQGDAYRALITDTGDLGLALEAALTSPYFLYRLEAGVELAEARGAGMYVPGAATPGGGSGSSGGGSGGGDVPAGTAVGIAGPDQFLPGSQGRREGAEWALVENGTVRVAFDVDMPEPAVLEVEARGSNHGDHWPELTVRAHGMDFGTQRVDSAEARLYRFALSGLSGRPQLELVFANDSGVAPYGPGQDANLYFRVVRLYTGGGTAPAPEPEPEPEPEPDPTGGTSVLDGAPEGAWVLTPYELASTLAFRLTGSTPDATLLEAARRGALSTREQIRAQVERLLETPRGRERMGDFVTAWFRLEDLPDVARPDVPELTDAVKASMLEEVRQHFLHVFYDDTAPWSEFFGGSTTFLDRTLAEFYGIEGAFDESFREVEVEGRGGPLASGAFMTLNAHVDRTAPILRAVRARETALCHYIDPPNSPLAGDDIDAQRAAAQQRVTEREAEAGVLSSREFYFLYTDGITACAGCHERIINPMFGMEDFDNVGRLRPAAGPGRVTETVHGMSTEVSLEGTLHGVASTSDAESIAYAGAKDFSNQIADTDAIDACLARRSFRFLTGATYVDRDLDSAFAESLTPEDRTSYACAAERSLEAFRASGESPRAMFVELATDSLLLFRR